MITYSQIGQHNNEPGGGPETQWTQVTAANGAENPAAREVMEILTRAYWRQLYTLARRRGLVHEDAADAVQEFLAKLLVRDGMHRTEPHGIACGAFLRRAFTNWLSNRHRHNTRDKRGGGAVIVPLEENASLRDLSASEDENPRDSFDRRWARSIYNQAMSRLRAEHENGARPEYFAALRAMTFGDESRVGVGEVAKRFGALPGTIRKAAFDLRVRFGQVLRREVARLVSDPNEVDSELRYLLTILTKD